MVIQCKIRKKLKILSKTTSQLICFFYSSTCICIEERNTCVWQPYTQEKLFCTYICNVDEVRLISICLLCIICRSWILLFIFSEADTEDSQRSTDGNIDLGHMKMIFFGNRKIWHISIYRTFTKIIHLLSHCIIKIYIFYLYVYTYM